MRRFASDLRRLGARHRLGTTVPRNAILARNLGQLAESLQSLPRHHYGCS